jgi:leucyl aminopeptidase
MRSKLLAHFLLTSITAVQAYTQDIEFADLGLPKSGRLVLLVQGTELGKFARAVDDESNGMHSEAMNEASFKGLKDTHLTLYSVSRCPRVDLVGLGTNNIDRNAVENVGGMTATKLDSVKGGNIQAIWSISNATNDSTIARLALVYLLRSCKFEKCFTDTEPPLNKLTLTLFSNDGSEEEFSRDLKQLVESVFLAREMSSEPGNTIYAQSFVDTVTKKLRGLRYIKIRVMDETDNQRLNMGAH